MGLQPGDPIDPNELPPAPSGATPAAPDGPAGSGWGARRWWLVGGAVAVVAAVVVVLVVALGGGTPRGERSAQAAAHRFLAAVDRHDGASAAAVSCSTFAGQARAIAHSESQGFRFTLGSVRLWSSSDAAVPLTQTLTFPGGTTQRSTRTLELQATSGHWLVCGWGS